MKRKLNLMLILLLIFLFIVGACVQNKQLLKTKGIKLYEQRDYKHSKNVFQKVLRIDSKDAEAHFYLGKLYLFQNKLDEASKEFSTSLKINPKMSKSFANLGIIAIMKKDYKAAITFLRNAVLYNPNDIMAWNNLGFVYLEKKNYSLALRYYKNSYDIAPDDPISNLNLAEIYRKILLDNQKAYFHYEKYLKTQKSETGTALEIRAWIQKMKDDKMISEEKHINKEKLQRNEVNQKIIPNKSNNPKSKSKIIDVIPKNKNSNMVRAKYFQAIGEDSYRKSLDILRKIVANESGNPELHGQLAIIYLRLGYFSKAIKELKIAKKIGIQDPEIIQLLDELSHLEEELKY